MFCIDSYTILSILVTVVLSVTVSTVNALHVAPHIDHYKQALAISRKMGDRRGEGIHLGNLGLKPTTAWASTSSPSNTTCRRCPSCINRELGDRRGECHNLGNLGLAYDSLGLKRSPSL